MKISNLGRKSLIQPQDSNTQEDGVNIKVIRMETTGESHSLEASSGNISPMNIIVEPQTFEVVTIPGRAGKSAYDIWLDQGNEGTQGDFLKWLTKSMLRYKGSVNTFAGLPAAEFNEVGDFWNVKDTGFNFVWDGEGWDQISGLTDLSNYVDRTTNEDIGGIKTFTAKHTQVKALWFDEMGTAHITLGKSGDKNMLTLFDDDIMTLSAGVKHFIINAETGFSINDKLNVGGHHIENLKDAIQPHEAINKKQLDLHVNREDNPHKVTKTQVGLSNVTNDKQATKTEFDTHKNSTSNPHSVTKSQVGLGDVNNTTDLAKPISTATQTALNLKADKTQLNNYVTTSAFDMQMLEKLGIKPNGTDFLIIGGMINPLYIDNASYKVNHPTASSQVAMLALDVPPGTVVVRLDTPSKELFLLTQLPASTLANWQVVSSNTIVSVAGKTGAVVLGITDISGLNSALTLKLDIATFESQLTQLQTAIDTKANKSELFSKNYNDLTNKPALKTVATTGSYNDLTNKPTIPTPTVNNYLTGVSGSGNGTVTFRRTGLSNLAWDAAHNHNQLYNTGDTRSTPTLPSHYDRVLKISGYKDAAAVGRAGSLMGVNGYNDPSGGVLELSWNIGNFSFRTAKNALEWNPWGEVASEQWVTSNTRSNTWTPSWGQVSGKPSFATVATSGNYNDLLNKPSIPGIPSILTTSEGNTGTATTQRTINAANLKSIILNHSPAGARPPTTHYHHTLYNGGASGNTYLRLSSGNELELFNSSNAVIPLFLNYSSTDMNGLLGPAGNVIWHAGNDGSGSGLDADLLDGLNSASTNTLSTIVARDSNGDFASRNIALAGSVTVGSATVNGTNSGTMKYDSTSKSIKFTFA